MGYGIRAHVWGDYALFTRPEMKNERVSYDVPTPSALRGLLQAIYWHPGMNWVIDRVYVCNPIRFTNIRRNEVNVKASATDALSMMNSGEKKYLYAAEQICQRASTILTNVSYVIDAHFELTKNAAPEDTPEKFYNIALRRLRNGQCYHQPCFGCREFPANFRIWEEENVVTAYPNETKDLGYMLFDMDYSDPDGLVPLFFRATLVNGVLDLTHVEVKK